MPLSALVCASLLGLANGTPPPTADYQQIKAASGRTPADQVRLALWCEAHGMTAERLRHLALAALADPTNTTARGLAGLVARNGRWVAPDSVAQTVRADAATTALLAKYDQKRSKTPYTADAQWALGEWADEQGLQDQAKAHYTAVTRLDPSREPAWKRLGYKKQDGRWTTDARVAAAKAEAEAQKGADRTWKPQLEKWKGMLAQPSRQVEARAGLLGVTDPRAVVSVVRVFGTDRPSDQRLAVGLLGQIESPQASRALAALAVFSATPDVRRAAVEILRRRDPHDFVGFWISLIRAPVQYEVRPVGGPGTPGVLFVADRQANTQRIYRPMDAPDPANYLDLTPNLNKLLEGIAAAAADPGSAANPWNQMVSVSQRVRVGGLTPVAEIQTQIPMGQLIREAQMSADLAQSQLADDVARLDASNAAIHRRNRPILLALRDITNHDLGEDSTRWNRWWTDQQGYAITSSSLSQAPTVVENLSFDLTPPPVPLEAPQVFGEVAIGFRVAAVKLTHHCFGAGTPVRTIDGAKRIERVQRGDLVLVQDTTTGALSYQPVLTAFHNPPSATYRVRLGADEVVATGIHRFWRAGKGWAMTRDLKRGDLIRTLGGVAAVEAVAPERVQPVFNLEVAEGRSFFVGEIGALVHDNSLVEATPNPFDAPGAGTTGAAINAPR